MRKLPTRNSNRKAQRVGAAVALVLLQLVSYQNCGSDFVVKDGANFVSSASSSCELTLAPDFQASYYPFLKTNCASCHTSRGPGNGAFADSSPDIAFAAFLTTGRSRIDINATNTAHSGNSGPQHTSAIAVAGQQWQNAEASCNGGPAGAGGPTAGTILTKEKVMQANATAKDLVWNLDSELSQPVSTGGASLTVAVREAPSANGTPVYFFSNPRLKAGSKSVSLKGLMIRINGQEQALGSTWSRVDGTAAPGATTPLSTAQVILEDNGYSVSDTLSLKIDSVTAQ
jgi:hypothetical protein